MKKVYLILMMLFLSFTSVKAQTSHTTAVDFAVTDTDGKSHNLFSFYPNPAVNDLTVESSGNEKINSIKIYDVLGKLLINLSVDNKERYVLNVAELERGIYYLEVTFENNATMTKKMRKQ